MDKELIRVENLKKYYDIKGGIITYTVSQIQAGDCSRRLTVRFIIMGKK